MLPQADLASQMRTLKAQFAKLPAVVQEHMNDATLVSVQQGARNAQANLLRSPSIDTRALHDHVGWAMNPKAGRGSFGVKVSTFTVKTTANFMRGEIGGRKIRVKGIVSGNRLDKPWRRAHFVEFGTTKMPAEPFMIPAAESIRNVYLDRCMRAGKGIERDMTVGRN